MFGWTAGPMLRPADTSSFSDVGTILATNTAGRWTRKGGFHRPNVQVAVTNKHGNRHRQDGPAFCDAGCSPRDFASCRRLITLAQIFSPKARGSRIHPRTIVPGSLGRFLCAMARE